MRAALTLRQLILWAVTCAYAAGATASQPLSVPFFPQQENGCGAASVAMVMHYWGPQAPAPDRVYQRLYDAREPGIRLGDMKRFLEESGFLAFTLRGQWADVEGHLAKGRPIIVGLKKKRSDRMHFAVLIGRDGDRIWVNDPTRKKANRVKQSEFEKQWNLADRWMLISTPSRVE